MKHEPHAIEWNYDTVANAEQSGPGADLLDDAHCFVPEDVPGLEVRPEY